MRSSPTLPPLLALRAFEAVGHLSSFRRAGEELLITQSAVSHHIRRLELDLGVSLFLRNGRTVALTSHGTQYLETVSKAFRVIRAGTEVVTGAADRVRVSLLPSFAANWLVPRLDEFSAACPGVELELDPTLRPVDLAAGEADVAIRYGDGQWPGGGRLLMTESLTPVLSPALQSNQPIGEPGDLIAHKLLTTSRPSDWSAWAEHAGIDLAAARTLQLTDYNIVLQAALDGQGVALGRLSLIEDRLAKAQLVAPCAIVLSSSKLAYWLIVPGTRPPSRSANRFCKWLINETAAALANRAY